MESDRDRRGDRGRRAGRAVVPVLSAGLGLLATLPVLALGLPFWAVGAVARGVRGALRARRPTPVPWRELMRYEPVVGWMPRARLRAYGLAERPFRLTTDAEGWRGSATVEEAEVVAFGDSFAFGHGADDRVLFSECRRRPRIKPIGANGYSMVHGVLWMERLADRLAGKTVAWLVFYANDLCDNLRPNLGRYRMPFVRAVGTDDWEIVTTHVGPEPWPCPAERDYGGRLAEICSPSVLSARAFAACEYLIGRARDVCRAADARLHVVGVPDPIQLTEGGHASVRRKAPEPGRCEPLLPDRRLRAICAAAGVPFTALSEHLTVDDYNPSDRHWTARGNRRVAEALARAHTSPATPHDAASAGAAAPVGA